MDKKSRTTSLTLQRLLAALDGSHVRRSAIETGKVLKSLQRKHPLIVVVKSLEMTWQELASLLSEKVTAFDADKKGATFSNNFNILTANKLMECARKSSSPNRSSLSSAPDCLPQIIREFGLHPNSLSSPDGYATTLTQTPFSLLWFFAWRYAQSIACRETAQLDRLVHLPVDSANDFKEYKNVVLSLTIKNHHPVRRLASIGHIASSLCYLFKDKNVYAMKRSPNQNLPPRPIKSKLGKKAFTAPWISDAPEIETEYLDEDELFKAWKDVDLAHGIKGVNFVERSIPIGKILFMELEPQLSLSSDDVCRVERLHSLGELTPYLVEDLKRYAAFSNVAGWGHEIKSSDNSNIFSS